jgi:hypothetical protein
MTPFILFCEFFDAKKAIIDEWECNKKLSYEQLISIKRYFSKYEKLIFFHTNSTIDLFTEKMLIIHKWFIEDRMACVADKSLWATKDLLYFI